MRGKKSENPWGNPKIRNWLSKNPENSTLRLGLQEATYQNLESFGQYCAGNVQKSGKIRNRISGYPNSGRHIVGPSDHPCQILAPWDVNCGRD